MTAEFDPKSLIRKLADIYNIKGAKSVPTLINNDQVQYTIDLGQGGFATYEPFSFSSTSALDTGTDITDIAIFNPTDLVFPADSIRNNNNHEIRILGMSVVIGGQGTGGGAAYNSLRFDHIYQGTTEQTEFSRIKIQKDTDPILWIYPNMTVESTGVFETSQGWSWNGHIPAGVGLTLFNDNLVNYGVGNLVLSVQGVRVSKGGRLPL